MIHSSSAGSTQNDKAILFYILITWPDFGPDHSENDGLCEIKSKMDTRGKGMPQSKTRRDFNKKLFVDDKLPPQKIDR